MVALRKAGENKLPVERLYRKRHQQSFGLLYRLFTNCRLSAPNSVLFC
jgi:hypothetical protein